MKKLFLAFGVFFSFSLCATLPEDAQEVKIEVTLVGPPSQELDNLVNVMSARGEEPMNYEEWSNGLIEGMHQLQILLESEKLYQGKYEIQSSNDVK